MLKKKQKATLDGYISKTRTNSESRLKFSESSPNFPQNSGFSAGSTHVGTRHGVSVVLKTQLGSAFFDNSTTLKQ